MERADRRPRLVEPAEVAHLPPEHRAHARLHLPGGLVRERDRQDVVRRNALAEAEQLVRGRAAVEVHGAGDATRVEQLRVHRVLKARVLDSSQILEAGQGFALGRRNSPRDDRVRGVLAVVRHLGTDAIVPEAGVEANLVLLRKLRLEVQVADTADGEARHRRGFRRPLSKRHGRRREKALRRFVVVMQLVVELLDELVTDGHERRRRVYYEHQAQHDAVPRGQAQANRWSGPPRHGSPSLSTNPTPRTV